MPTPNPTAMAMISLVDRPELELEVVPDPVSELPVLLPLLLVFVGLGVEADVPSGPVADVVLPLPLPCEDPVATGIADTIAVVVLLGCGLFSLGWHENMTEWISIRSVPAANCLQLSLSPVVLMVYPYCTPHAVSE